MGEKNKPRYETFRVTDRTGTIQHPLLVVGESFESLRVVFQEKHQFHNKISDHTVLLAHLAENHEEAIKQNLIYYKQASAPELLTALVASYKKVALEEEATPEAIRLLGSLEPWTKKEVSIMAEKLKAKASAAKPDKETLKTAAKAAPVAKGGTKAGAPKRGNAEALAKARAAKGPDTRKIKPLIKAKDNPAREGTFRAGLIADALNSKTVAELREKNSKYDSGCIKFLVDSNIVSLSA